MGRRLQRASGGAPLEMAGKLAAAGQHSGLLFVVAPGLLKVSGCSGLFGKRWLVLFCSERTRDAPPTGAVRMTRQSSVDGCLRIGQVVPCAHSEGSLQSVSRGREKSTDADPRQTYMHC